MTSSTDINYPIIFAPVYKDYIWGGERIPQTYKRDLPPGIYAESWEMCDRPEGMSIVANGPLAGTPFDELIKLGRSNLLGSAVTGEAFPLLIKLIDSKQSLSVQVHPNDGNAESVDGEAKTEMWYVLAADPDAQVYAGLKAGTSKAEFEKALKEEKLEKVLNAVPVTKGDAVYIPGGRVHAIDAGCLLLEIQQNSNTTYRVYDWGRMGHDGKPRELHQEKAMQVISWEDKGQIKYRSRKIDDIGANSAWLVMDSEYFRVEKLLLTEPMPHKNGGRSFHAFFVESGTVSIEANGIAAGLTAGMACMIPACVEDYQIVPAGEAEVIRIRLP